MSSVRVEYEDAVHSLEQRIAYHEKEAERWGAEPDSAHYRNLHRGHIYDAEVLRVVLVRSQLLEEARVLLRERRTLGAHNHAEAEWDERARLFLDGERRREP